MADFFDIITTLSLPQPVGTLATLAREIYENREEIAESEIVANIGQTAYDIVFALTSSRSRLLTADKYPPPCKSILCR